MATTQPQGGGDDSMRAFLDQVVCMESVYVTRETAMRLSFVLDQEWDLVFEVGMLPAETGISQCCIFNAHDAMKTLLQQRQRMGMVIDHPSAASLRA